MTDEKYNLSPSKETYRSLKSDVSPISAVKELIDNVIDNWRRVDQKNPSVTIDIDFDPENDYFRIEDDSGGIEDGEIEKIFALGESNVNSVSQPIGAYGMGAKKAIVRLGREATIKSRTIKSATGYGFTVDEEWLNKPNDWEVDRREFENVSKGTTVIEIRDLQTQFDSNDEENQSRFNNLNEFTKGLLGELATTYEEFLLGRAGPDEGEISIVVNGEKAEPPKQPSWSHTPFDGFHLRNFQNVELDVPNREDPVFLDLTAGLLTSGGQEEAGTDIYIQNRKIVSQSIEEDGGWGTYLPNYQPALGRARFQIRLYTEGRTDTLPWDTQKSNIDPYDPVMREAFEFLERAGEAFAKARYGAFPVPLTKPYNASNKKSVSESPEEYDYSTRNYVMHAKGHTPDTNYTQAKEVMELVDKHIQNSISASYLVADDLQPGYDGRYEDQNDEEVWEVPEEVQVFSEQILHAWIEEVDKIASADAANSRKIAFNEDSPWWASYYKQQLTKYADNAPNNERSPPDLEQEIKDRKSAGRLPKPILNKAANDALNSGFGQEDGKSTSEDKETPSSDEVSDQTSEDVSSSSENSEDSEEKEDSTSESHDTSNMQPSDTASDSDEEAEEEGIDFGSSDRPDRIRRAEDDEELIVIRASTENYELLCDQLDLPKNAAPERVGDALLQSLIPLLGDNS